MIAGLFVTALVMLAPAARSQTDGSSPEGGRSQWRAMLRERITACAEKSDGTACSFSREGQTVSGTCRTTRRGQLVCRTGEGGRGREKHGSTGGGMPAANAPEE